jgi:hypothetical protein
MKQSGILETVPRLRFGLMFIHINPKRQRGEIQGLPSLTLGETV